MNDRLAEFAFLAAASNWAMWRADFEFGGNPTDLPVLVCEKRFHAFVSEYGLLHGIKKPKRENIRVSLSKWNYLNKINNCEDRYLLDDIVKVAKNEFIFKNTEMSLISKLAAFARPEKFVAWDRYIRRGVSFVIIGSREKIKFENYEHFF